MHYDDAIKILENPGTISDSLVIDAAKVVLNDGLPGEHYSIIAHNALSVIRERMWHRDQAKALTVEELFDQQILNGISH